MVSATRGEYGSSCKALRRLAGARTWRSFPDVNPGIYAILFTAKEFRAETPTGSNQTPDSIAIPGASVAIASSGGLNPANPSITGQREDASGFIVYSGDPNEDYI